MTVSTALNNIFQWIIKFELKKKPTVSFSDLVHLPKKKKKLLILMLI